MKDLNLLPEEIAAFFLRRALDDGDLITNLKMQKLIYYAYCWVLTLNNARLFKERMQAWPNGPVLASLYKLLNKYGSSPISSNFVASVSLERMEKLDQEVLYTLKTVYEAYVPKAAYELVALTHNESPWKNAREGMSVTERSNKELSDEDIINYFSKL